MFSVHQHWDPLKVCILGRAYPPEFYSWIKNPKTRSLFERMAIETEEDFQAIQRKLEEFGVEVLRPNLPKYQGVINGSYVRPPMTPRDYTVMIGSEFYESYSSDLSAWYNKLKDPSWPDCYTVEDLLALPNKAIDELKFRGMDKFLNHYNSVNCYNDIFERIKQEGNTINNKAHPLLSGAMVSRIGKDLYFGTFDTEDQSIKPHFEKMFPDHRIHVVDTQAHSDGSYCPVAPGLIISLEDVANYKESFPNWEVVYLPDQSWEAVKPFLDLKARNFGKWWIPGHEYDDDVLETVETWLDDWVGYVEETVFDVNMLVIDPKNVLVFNYNKKVFDALERHGITPHIVTFRHRFFWDGGIHCITTDLHREGSMNDYFPKRS